MGQGQGQGGRGSRAAAAPHLELVLGHKVSTHIGEGGRFVVTEEDDDERAVGAEGETQAEAEAEGEEDARGEGAASLSPRAVEGSVEMVFNGTVEEMRALDDTFASTDDAAEHPTDDDPHPAYLGGWNGSGSGSGFGAPRRKRPFKLFEPSAAVEALPMRMGDLSSEVAPLALSRVLGFGGASHNNLCWHPESGHGFFYSVGCNLVQLKETHQHTVGGHTRPVSVMAMSANGRFIVSGSGPTARDDETSLIFWQLDSHHKIRRARPRLHTHDATGVQSLCFLRNQFVVVGGCFSHERQGTSISVFDMQVRALSLSALLAVLLW